MLPIREQAARWTRKKRTRTRPQAEALDDRVVPAVMGVGHGGFAAGQNPYALRVQEVRQQRMAQQEARLEQIHALRQQRMLMMQERLQARAIRANPNFGGVRATQFSNLNVGPYAHSFPVTVGASTPAGPLATGSHAMNSTPISMIGSTSAGTSQGSNVTTPSTLLANPSATTTSGDTGSTGSNSGLGGNGDSVVHPTSPNDFPYGPGGFYNIVDLPGGADGGAIGHF